MTQFQRTNKKLQIKLQMNKRTVYLQCAHGHTGHERRNDMACKRLLSKLFFLTEKLLTVRFCAEQKCTAAFFEKGVYKKKQQKKKSPKIRNLKSQQSSLSHEHKHRPGIMPASPAFLYTKLGEDDVLEVNIKDII